MPQSISVVTRERIRDQSFQTVAETVRYVPGVVPAQGEGHRDEVVIRGQRSNADFFVNGIRDDAQYLRDLYNVNRVEVLKGPNAMIFGRGAGGGVINRVLKEADGVPIREFTLQGGSFFDRRFTMDVGDAITPNVAARINGLYEKSESYRKFATFERYGINPTLTFSPDSRTSLRLSYEYFHDDRVVDRGIPSQFGRPYRYRTNRTTFFGNPDLSYANVDAHIATAVLEHETDFGLKIRSQSRYANYANKFYQNVYAGGPVSADGTSVRLSAYSSETPRENLFNQTDFIYKFETGFLKHTFLSGFEVGHQSGLSFRKDGFFNDRTANITVSPLFPISFAPVTFRHTTGANHLYSLGLAAVYAQDQVQVADFLEIIGGLRFDRFDLETTNRGTGETLTRVDNLVSPRIGAVLKPLDNLSLYGSFSVSYLPSAGDQFSSLSPGTVAAEPEKFVNKEVGVKWDVFPRLQFTAAVYELDRTNQRVPDPNRPGFFLLNGETRTRGFEIGANGYITDQWQVAGGYAFTDARIAKNLSETIVAGNTVGLVPFNTFSLWNKYQITPEFGVGLGVITQTHTYASSDNRVRLPGFTRFDAALFYKFSENLRAQINVENLFDRHYIATAHSNDNIMPGSPRAVRFAVIATF